MAFTDIYIYTSEVVPTEVRNIGMGTASFCARISGMAAPYVGGILGSGVLVPAASISNSQVTLLPRSVTNSFASWSQNLSVMDSRNQCEQHY